ncbi:unnamed protein product [Ambrosiozyma monospora]|uniref:Unnamed protein product n=1 Tax=Ambrosiozyma monospora TaxID=43982 RepID=A0ACB5TB98_AMBMO|nr:unnamed protein product [Ambrosiozyma monospora]
MRSIQAIIEDFINEFNPHHLVKLLIIIGGYIFFRQRFMDFMKQKQIKNQLAADEETKKQNLIERPEDYMNSTGVEASESGWGWGKNTRRKVKKQQQLFEEEIEKSALRAQNNSGYDSDDDIKELLID